MHDYIESWAMFTMRTNEHLCASQRTSWSVDKSRRITPIFGANIWVKLYTYSQYPQFENKSN